MIFNFTKKFQFTTNLSVNDKEIEVVDETKLLGTYLTSDLKWNKNTSELIKKAYKRMPLLTRAAAYTSNSQDLKRIYLTYIRSILDQSAVLWHSSLTEKNRNNIERVQKVAVRVILGRNYKNYKNGLNQLRMEKLNTRREFSCLKFAKNCLNNEKVKDIFPKSIKIHKMKTRNRELFKVKFSKTKRYKKSAIPYMINLLNNNDKKKLKIINQDKE